MVKNKLFSEINSAREYEKLRGSSGESAFHQACISSNMLYEEKFKLCRKSRDARVTGKSDQLACDSPPTMMRLADGALHNQVVPLNDLSQLCMRAGIFFTPLSQTKKSLLRCEKIIERIRSKVKQPSEVK